MSTLQDSIAEIFLEDLSGTNAVEPHVIDQLRALLDKGRKPKVDDLLKLFTSLPDGEVK